MRRVVVDVVDLDDDRCFVGLVRVTVSTSGSDFVGRDAVDADGQPVSGDGLAIERGARHDHSGLRVDREHGRVELIAEVGNVLRLHLLLCSLCKL